MADKLIPQNALRAAQRGFIRTGAQSIATGAVVPGALVLTFTHDGLLALGAAAAGIVFNAVVNGAQSFFSILASGIPEAYAPELDKG